MSEMSENAALRQHQDAASPTVRAAGQLWAEIERAKAQREDADALIKRLAGTLEILLDDLPASERNDYRQRLAKLRNGETIDGRGKDVHNNIIDLLKRTGRRDWTVPEIQAALSKEGEEADPKVVKAIYNAVHYLAKKGMLRRVSWGQYVSCESGGGVADYLDHIVPDDGTIRRRASPRWSARGEGCARSSVEEQGFRNPKVAGPNPAVRAFCDQVARMVRQVP
jgi:hypothetical protein